MLTLFAAPSIIAVAVFAALALFVYVKRPPPPLWPVLFWVQFTGVLWAVGDLGSTFLTTSREWHGAWLGVEYVGIIFLPVTWWLLALRFSESQGTPMPGPTRLLVRVPAIVSCVLVLCMLTNPWHGQFLTAHVGQRSDFRWLWWLQAGWSYVLTLGTMVVYGRLRWRLSTAEGMSQVNIMLAAPIVSLSANVVYVFWPSSLPFDTTILALALAGLLFYVGIYRSGLFGLLPVALPEITRQDPDGVLLLESNGTVLYANPAVGDLFGSGHLHPGVDAFAFLAEELHLPGLRGTHGGRAEFADLVRRLPDAREEQVFRFGSEHARWLRVEATRIPLRRGQGVVHCLRFREVTQFKRATIAVAEQAAALEAILGSAHEGILVVDRSGRMIYYNRVFQDMWSLPNDVMATGDDAAALECVRQQLANPDSFFKRVQELYGQPTASAHDEIHLRDGRIFERQSRPLIRDGRPAGRVWSFRDETERRAAQRALARSEETYRSILDGALDPVITIAEDGRVRSWNPAAERMFGWPADAVLGKDLTDLIVPEAYREAHRSGLERYRTDGTAPILGQALELFAVRRDGTEFPIELTVTSIRVGNERRFLGFVRDMTERKEAADALQRQGNLLRGVAEASRHLLATTDLPSAMRAALGVLGTAAGVDRVYVLAFHPHPETRATAVSLRHLWAADTAPRVPDLVRENLPLEAYGFAEWHRALAQGQAINGPLREFPDVDQAYFAAHGVLSHLLVPIEVDDKLWGLVGLDDCQTERRWTAYEESILSTMAANVASALQRSQAVEALARTASSQAHLVGIAERLHEELPLEAKLNLVAEETVERFEADFVRVFVLRPGDRCTHGCPYASVPAGDPMACTTRDQCLHMVGNASRHPDVDETLLTRVPVGVLLAGRIAAGEYSRYVTNDMMQDPNLYGGPVTEWLGLRGFVGVRLTSPAGGARGVLTVMKRDPVTSEVETALATLAEMVSHMVVAEQAKVAVQASEERYRRLIENAPLGVIACDRTGKVLAANDYIVTMLGSPSREATLAVNMLTLPALVESGVSAAIRHTMETGECHTEELTYTSLWGSTVDIRMNLAPIRETEGAIMGVQAVVEDVTEQRQAEAALLHAQKLESLGVLAGGIAHDFNNLLVSMMGNAGLALCEVPTYSPARPHLTAIEKAAERASDLTQQLLAYAGKGKFVVEPLDITDAVQEMTDLLDVSIGKNVTVDYDLARALPAVEADGAQLRQIVMNLVLNASDAIGQHPGVITMRTGLREVTPGEPGGEFQGQAPTPGRYVYVEVADTGCGMDAETRARIFDPFFTTKFTGRGLGLAAVLGIVQGHGGTLEVESTPGRGSRFTVLLPCTEAPVVPPSAAVPAAGPPDTWRAEGTILIVDDDPGVLRVAGLILERAGFGVLTARDGQEALEIFPAHEEEIVLVLLDLTMPRMSGEETFQGLRALRPDIRVILSTGYSEHEAMGQFAGQGLAGFVQKPYRAQALLAKVRDVLEVHTAQPV